MEDPLIVRVDVSPDSAEVVVGTEEFFRAQAEDGSGSVRYFGVDYRWASSDDRVAVVDGTGVARGVGPGIAEISASVDGVRGSATLVVAPIPLRSISITPGSDTLYVAERVQLEAILVDEAGVEVSDRTPTWTSRDSMVVTVDQRGGVLAVGEGATQVLAQAEGRTGFAHIDVGPGVTLRGFVGDEFDDRPIANAQVTVQDRSQTTGDDGTFGFELLEARETRISVSADQYEPEEVVASLLPGQNVADFALRAATRGRIAGVVLDGLDEPVPGATIRLRDLTTETDALGRFALPAVPLGNYEVLATADYYQPDTLSVLLFEAELDIALRLRAAPLAEGVRDLVVEEHAWLDTVARIVWSSSELAEVPTFRGYEVWQARNTRDDSAFELVATLPSTTTTADLSLTEWGGYPTRVMPVNTDGLPGPSEAVDVYRAREAFSVDFGELTDLDGYYADPGLEVTELRDDGVYLYQADDVNGDGLLSPTLGLPRDQRYAFRVSADFEVVGPNPGGYPNGCGVRVYVAGYYNGVYSGYPAHLRTAARVMTDAASAHTLDALGGRLHWESIVFPGSVLHPRRPFEGRTFISNGLEEVTLLRDEGTRLWGTFEEIRYLEFYTYRTSSGCMFYSARVDYINQAWIN